MKKQLFALCTFVVVCILIGLYFFQGVFLNNKEETFTATTQSIGITYEDEITTTTEGLQVEYDSGGNCTVHWSEYSEDQGSTSTTKNGDQCCKISGHEACYSNQTPGVYVDFGGIGTQRPQKQSESDDNINSIQVDYQRDGHCYVTYDDGEEDMGKTEANKNGTQCCRPKNSSTCYSNTMPGVDVTFGGIGVEKMNKEAENSDDIKDIKINFNKGGNCDVTYDDGVVENGKVSSTKDGTQCCDVGWGPCWTSKMSGANVDFDAKGEEFMKKS